jgi:hypothetical protein
MAVCIFSPILSFCDDATLEGIFVNCRVCCGDQTNDRMYASTPNFLPAKAPQLGVSTTYVCTGRHKEHLLLQAQRGR